MIRRRLRILILALAVPYLVILGRLYSLQVVPETHQKYARLALHQKAVPLPPVRGRILAADGTELAGNEPRYQLWMDLEDLDPRQVPFAIIARGLREHAGMAEIDEAGLERHLAALVDPRSLVDRAVEDEVLDPESDAVRFVENVPDEAAEWLRQCLGRHRSIAVVKPSEPGGHEVLLHAQEALRKEIVLYRLARRLADSPGKIEPTYAALRDRVTETVRKIQEGAESEVEAYAQAQADEGRDVDASTLSRKRRGALAARYRQSWLLRDEVPPDVVTQVEYHPDLYPGIRAVMAMRRIYKQGESCGTITGYVRKFGEKRDKDGKVIPDPSGFLSLQAADLEGGDFEDVRAIRLQQGDYLGETGLEKMYDARLRGAYGRRIEMRARWGEAHEILDEESPTAGQNVHTSLRWKLQKELHDALREAVERQVDDKGRRIAPAFSGSAAVLDLRSAALLASASYPGLDPNLIGKDGYLKSLEPGATLHGPAQKWLAPGSVFKLVVAVAAMEEGKPWEGDYTPERRYECRDGTFPPLSCANTGHDQGSQVGLEEAIQYSCNNYFYYLGTKHLAPDRIHHWAGVLGYGRETGIDLPLRSMDLDLQHDTKKPLPLEKRHLRSGNPEKSWLPGERCHLSIGQVWVEATPLQVLRSVAAVALRGRALPRPHLVPPVLQGSVDGAVPGPAAPWEQLPSLRPETMDRIRCGMWRVGHEPGGTAADTVPPLSGFLAAFKSGTAQVVKTGTGHLYHAWLVGFAPVEEPRIAFVVVLEKTSLTAGPACASVVGTILRHFAEEDGAAYLVDPNAGAATPCDPVPKAVGRSTHDR